MFHPFPVIFVLLFVRLRKCFVEVSLWWDHHPLFKQSLLNNQWEKRYKENTKITRTWSQNNLSQASRKNRLNWSINISYCSCHEGISIIPYSSGEICPLRPGYIMLHPKWQSFPGTIFRHQTRNNTFVAAIVYETISLQGLCWNDISQNLPSLQLSSRARGWKFPRLNPRGERLDARRQSPKCGAPRKGSSWNLPSFTWKKLESWAI